LKVAARAVGHHREIDEQFDVLARQGRGVQVKEVFLLVPADDPVLAGEEGV